MKQVEVVFCGNSLYLSGLAASLQANKQFRISIMEHVPAKAMPELKMFCPDVVIFEVDSNPTAMLSSLRRADLKVVVIIVDPATDSLTVLWGEWRLTASVDRLAPVIIENVERKDQIPGNKQQG